MSKIPVFTAVRIIPRESEFLDRKAGSRGEIFFDRDTNTLRLYDGENQGGVSLAKADLTNVSNATFAAKATAAGVGSGGGNTTVSVGATVPSSPSSGNLWLNTNNGSLYVYINDGDSNQWIQPAVPTPDLTSYVLTTTLDAYATKSYVDTATANIPREQFEIYIAADDSTQRRISTGNVVQFIGAGGVTTTSDADGNITITGGGTTGNVTFSGTDIDSSDSSGISFVPAVTFQSDVTVENELKVNLIDSINGISAVEILPSVNFKGAIAVDASITSQIVSVSTSITTPSLFVDIVDTTDSSSITFTPAVSFSSDITVENDIFVNNIVFASAGVDTPKLTSSGSITISSTTGIMLDGLATFNRSTEIVNNKTGSTGTVVHDFSTGSLFFHSNIAANFTANFTNVPTTNDRSISVALILDQGSTPYIPNAVEVNGSSETIKWSGGSPPSGTANYVDIVNFTLIRSGSAWTVLGSLSTYN